MGRLLVRRLVALIPVLLIVSFGVFGLIALVPGDAAVQLAGGQNATAERVAESPTAVLMKPKIVELESPIRAST